MTVLNVDGIWDTVDRLELVDVGPVIDVNEDTVVGNTCCTSEVDEPKI